MKTYGLSGRLVCFILFYRLEYLEKMKIVSDKCLYRIGILMSDSVYEFLRDGVKSQ